MGRLYSGNLNAFKAAELRFEPLGFIVQCDEFYDYIHQKNVMKLWIGDMSNRMLAMEAFAHHDEDVLYNTATEWLNRIATQLSTWSKY